MHGRLLRVTVVLGVLGAGIAGAAASTAAGASTATPACSTRGLVAWLDTNGNGYAGGVVYQLHFTNLSGRACTLRGWPGVSAVDLRGRRIGPSAGRSTGVPVRTVRLRRGRTATSLVQVADAGNFTPSICHETDAAGFRVYPPGQRASRVIPFPFQACAGERTLSVRPVTR